MSHISIILKVIVPVLLIATIAVFLAAHKEIPTKSSGTFYVASFALSSGSGHAWQPLKDLGEALELITDRPTEDRVIVFSGTFSDEYIIPDGVSLIGRGHARINGSVVVSEEASLSHFTVTGAGAGLHLTEGSRTTINKMKLIDNVGDGIDAKYHVHMRADNSIIKGNEKGVHVRRGSDIVLENSLVAENRQEGVDIRSRTTSIVRENRIINNNHNGMEYVIGGSTASIIDNVSNGNGKSGLTIEYSNLAPELGSLHIENNTIHNNVDFGVRCVSRTGGTRTYRYFAKSTQEIDNDITGSGNKDIATLCKFGTVPFEGI